MKENKHQGFTLVEIVITIAVFAIILPAILGMVVSLNNINDRAQDQALVHAAAQSKAEELRSIGFNGVNTGDDFSDELPATLSGGQAAYTVDLYDAGGTEPEDPSLKVITISINYIDEGATRDFVYKTYLGELGVGQY